MSSFHFTNAVVGRCWFQPYDCHHLLCGVVSVRLQILLVGTYRLCGSWSVTGHSHRKVIGQDPICADLHDLGLGLSGNGWAETMCDEGDWNLVIRLICCVDDTFTRLLSILNVGLLNPLKCSGIRWLHLKLFSAIQV